MTEHPQLSRRRLLQLATASAATGEGKAAAERTTRTRSEREPVENTEEWSEVVYIEIVYRDCSGVCTGVLVSDHHVLTAGHCIYDHPPGFACADGLTDRIREDPQGWALVEWLQVHPAAARDDSGSYFPYDQAEVRMQRIHPGWTNEQWPDDLALLTLDRPIGKAAGSRSVHHIDDPADDDVLEQEVKLLGYPTDELRHTMWLAAGPGESIDDGMHAVDLGTHEGMSGGPIINDAGDVVSIYSKSGGLDVDIPPWNDPHAVWFNDDRYEWLNEKIAEDDPWDGMPMPVFDGTTEHPSPWAPGPGGGSIRFVVDGEQFNGRDDDEPEIVAGEQTLRVRRDVRNVGPIAPENERLFVEFSLDRTEGGDVVEEGVVQATRGFDMPAPYETEDITWDHTFDEEAVDDAYRARLQIMDPDDPNEKMNPDEKDWLDTKALRIENYLDSEDSPTVTVVSGESTPTLDLSATGELRDGTAVISVTLTNTGSEPVEDPTVQFLAETDELATTSYYRDEFEVVDHTDDGGDWFYEGWGWESIGPGASKAPSVTLAPADDLPAGEYTFGLQAYVPDGGVTVIDTATATITLMDDAPSGPVDARIVGVDVASGTYSTGDVVAADVTVENTGGRDHTFYVGYSVKDPSGTGWHNDGTTDETVTLDPGETKTVTVTWTVEDDAPSGTYDAVVALWRDRDGDSLTGNLDDRRVRDAFEVRKATGPVDARIVDLQVASGTYSTGDVVPTEVTVENAGGQEHTFYVGYSVKDPSGTGWHNEGTTDEPLTLRTGETKTVTVTWTVERDAPSGGYDAVVVVWKNRDGDSLTGNLDDRRRRSAFTVE